jgi:hypothetical protein
MKVYVSSTQALPGNVMDERLTCWFKGAFLIARLVAGSLLERALGVA